MRIPYAHRRCFKLQALLICTSSCVTSHCLQGYYVLTVSLCQPAGLLLLAAHSRVWLQERCNRAPALAAMPACWRQDACESRAWRAAAVAPDSPCRRSPASRQRSLALVRATGKEFAFGWANVAAAGQDWLQIAHSWSKCIQGIASDRTHTQVVPQCLLVPPSSAYPAAARLLCRRSWRRHRHHGAAARDASRWGRSLHVAGTCSIKVEFRAVGFAVQIRWIIVHGLAADR